MPHPPLTPAQIELDLRVQALQAEDTPARRAAVLAAQRVVRDEFFAEERAEWARKVGAR